MRKLFAVIVFLLLSASVAAQPQLTLVWNQNEVEPAVAQTYLYRYYLDQLPGTVLQGVLCKLTVDKTTECSVPLPTPSIGLHQIQITAENEYGEGPKSAPLSFRYPAVPGPPQNLRIIK